VLTGAAYANAILHRPKTTREASVRLREDAAPG
jgi:hypothetical protein